MVFRWSVPIMLVRSYLNSSDSYLLKSLHMSHGSTALPHIVSDSYGILFFTVWPPTEPASRAGGTLISSQKLSVFRIAERISHFPLEKDFFSQPYLFPERKACERELRKKIKIMTDGKDAPDTGSPNK